MLEKIECKLFLFLGDRSRGFRILGLEAQYMAGKGACPTWQNVETPDVGPEAGAARREARATPPLAVRREMRG